MESNKPQPNNMNSLKNLDINNESSKLDIVLPNEDISPDTLSMGMQNYSKSEVKINDINDN